jgi:hypothetical protein
MPEQDTEIMLPEYFEQAYYFGTQRSRRTTLLAQKR